MKTRWERWEWLGREGWNGTSRKCSKSLCYFLHRCPKCGISSAPADDAAKQVTELEFLRVCGMERWSRAQEKHHCLEEGGVRRGTGSHTHEKKGTLVRRRKLHKLKDQGKQCQAIRKSPGKHNAITSIAPSNRVWVGRHYFTLVMRSVEIHCARTLHLTCSFEAEIYNKQTRGHTRLCSKWNSPKVSWSLCGVEME